MEHQLCTLIRAGITADFIPHDQFHKGIWLKPVITGKWYYFYPSERNNQIHDASSIIESLDESLKDLVIFLHSRNIPTTPSCEGHFFSESYFREKYDALMDDFELIRQSGLLMKNEENSEFFFVKNPKFRLPWNRNNFIKIAGAYQQRGVLGIIDPSNQTELASVKVPGVTVKTDEEVVLFLVNTGDSDRQKKAWQETELMIKRIYE